MAELRNPDPRSEVVLGSPRVIRTIETDAFAGRLATVLDALTTVDLDVPSVSVREQIGQLSWSLCRRAGGRICSAGAQTERCCARHHSCMLIAS